MYPKLFFSLFVTLLILSCGNNAPTEPIELNIGEKWKVNAEMMPPLKASEKLIADYSSDEKKDFKALAGQLKENNKKLISSCTMKGKSHDELHKWLHPYMTLVAELEDAEDENEASLIHEKMVQSFDTFNQFFQ